MERRTFTREYELEVVKLITERAGRRPVGYATFPALGPDSSSGSFRYASHPRSIDFFNDLIDADTDLNLPFQYKRVRNARLPDAGKAFRISMSLCIVRCSVWRLAIRLGKVLPMGVQDRPVRALSSV